MSEEKKTGTQKLAIFVMILAIVAIVGLSIYLLIYGEQIMQHPCQLCEDKGYDCTKFNIHEGMVPKQEINLDFEVDEVSEGELG